MVTPGAEALWLWLGSALLGFGALWFLRRGRGTDEPVATYYVVLIFAVAIASIAYLVMATGVGLVRVEVVGLGGVEVYWARYADWLVTTPLVLYLVCRFAGANRAETATVMGLDVLMILTGTAGALATEGQAVRVMWWAVSTAALLRILYVLLNPLSERVAGDPAPTRRRYRQLSRLIVGVWLAYPVVWIAGTESGFALLPLFWETGAYMVLDFCAKVVFGYLLVRDHAMLRSAP